ncbi:MAG: MOSC domain-containing protein [Gammaproteobacteria bacterium]|nr:MOSC domain-containing protein [Gammaproteobacteria bacterium]
MTEITLSGLFRYPVKSLRGTPLTAASLDPRGIALDRHWMLVDGTGGFLSQRKLPRMTLIQCELLDDRLCLEAPGMPALEVGMQGQGGEMEVKVWQDRCLAMGVGAEVDSWLSNFLETECKLVYLPPGSRRQVDQQYASPSDQTGFSDGFPLLLISQASLDDLNGRLKIPVTMERFRPNLVVSGCEPYAEDRWRKIRMGGVTFRVAKPCSRCPVPTIDPETAERGVEPIKTLNGYRRRDNKVYFGQNLLHDGLGELKQGMAVELIEVDPA